MTDLTKISPTIPRSQDPNLLKEYLKLLTALQLVESKIKDTTLRGRDYSHTPLGWEAARAEKNMNLETVRELIDYYTEIVLSLNDNQR